MNELLFNRKWNANVDALAAASDERVYERVGDGYRLTVKGTSEGKEFEWGYTAPKDGELFPVHGREDVDSIIAHTVTEDITIGEFHKDGEIVAAYRRGLEKDGNTLIVTVSGIGVDGKPYFNVIRYSLKD